MAWSTVTAVAAPERMPEAEVAPPERRLRVLVVDDSPINRELIRALLEPFSPVIEEAADGGQAVEAAGREPFDMVLMDLQMPGMDGVAAARAIRSGTGPNRETPIVAVSASVQPSDVEACRAAGMDDHVPKPISAGDLLSKVSHWTAEGVRAA